MRVIKLNSDLFAVISFFLPGNFITITEKKVIFKNGPAFTFFLTIRARKKIIKKILNLTSWTCETKGNSLIIKNKNPDKIRQRLLEIFPKVSHRQINLGKEISSPPKGTQTSLFF